VNDSEVAPQTRRILIVSAVGGGDGVGDGLGDGDGVGVVVGIGAAQLIATKLMANNNANMLNKILFFIVLSPYS